MTSVTFRSHRFVARAVERCARVGRGLLVGALVALALPAAAADAPAAGGAGTAAAGLSSELIKPGLYRIHGPGGGTLLRIGSSGLIVVDSQPAGTYPALVAEIQRLAQGSDPAVRALVLTAAGPEQAGNVTQFLGAGARLVATDPALQRLRAQHPALAAAPAGRIVGYGIDFVLHTAGVSAEIDSVGRGRTGADSIVFFPDLRTVAVGELFTHGTPQPDCASGGSFAGWAAAIEHFKYFAFDVAVPSRGPPVGKADLLAFRERLLALADRAASSPAGTAGCLPQRP